MGHFALDDVPFPIAKVEELEAKLRAAGVNFDFYRYPAKHAFANETADETKLAIVQYNPAAAELAWKRTVEFLAKTLH
jgi:carboxymethylenebutenolidase